MTGLEAQLGGMGVAFASSLLGLAGSLVVGLLELFASHGQNRFYRELEEWMSTITRVGFAGGGEGESSAEGAMLAGALDHMSAQMDGLNLMLSQSDMSRAMVDEKLDALSAALDRLSDRLGGEGPQVQALMRVAEGQETLIATLTQRYENGADANTSGGLDAESRMRLRSIDVQMLRILEEISAGRQESTTELRTDLAELKRAVQDMVPEFQLPPATPRRPER